MGANRRIVQQRGDGRWEVKAPRADRASAVADTQAAAIDRAHKILRNDGGGELTIKEQTDGYEILTPCLRATIRIRHATVGR